MSEKRQPILVVDTNSWHYRYFTWVRNLYGTQPKPSTSLCPYVQTIIWGTVVFALTLPFLIVGYMFIRAGRLTYKQLEKHGYQKVVDYLDKKKWFSLLFDVDGNEAAMGYTLVGAGVSCLGWVLFLVLYVGMLGMIAVVPHIPYAIYSFALWFGWMMTWGGAYVVYGILGAGHGIAWLAVTSWHGIVSFFTNANLWLRIGIILGRIVIGILGLFAIGVSTYYLTYSEWFADAAGWLSMKFNGYSEAKQEATIRRAAEEAKDPPTELKPSRISVTFFALLDGMRDVCGDFIKLFRQGKVVVKNKSHKVMGFFSIIWAVVWSIKKQACPIVQFVDASKLNTEEKEGETNVS